MCMINIPHSLKKYLHCQIAVVSSSCSHKSSEIHSRGPPSPTWAMGDTFVWDVFFQCNPIRKSKLKYTVKGSKSDGKFS